MSKRFGIVGAGGQGFRRAEALTATDRAVLVGVASRSLASAKKLAESFGAKHATADYTEMANWGLDGLIVTTPNDSHYEITKWGLEQGLDILVEGPVCIEIDHALELEELAKEKGLLVEVGFNSVYHPLFEKAKELISREEIGKPVLAYATALWKAPPDSWYYLQSPSGGMPLTHLSYNFNRMRYLMGKPLDLMARANQVARRGQDWVQEETCAVIFTFASGALGSLVASYAMEERQPDRGIRVVGTDGCLQVTSECLTISNEQFERTIELAPEQPSSLGLQVRAFLRNMEIRQEGKNPISDAIIDLKIANAITQSHRTGRAVRLV